MHERDPDEIPAGVGLAGLRRGEIGPSEDFDTTPFPKGCRYGLPTPEIGQIQP